MTRLSSGDLMMTLEAQRQRARQAVDKWDPEQFLATTEADVVDYLVAEYSVPCPVLHRDQIEQLPVSEEVQSAAGMFSGETYRRRAAKIAIAVPFDGDKAVFRLRASTFSVNPARVEVREAELRLKWTDDTQVAPYGSAIRRHFDGQLDKIEEQLSWSRGDIDSYHADLRAMISTAAAERKAKLLADRQLEAGLGFPVRQRPDAALYAVPVKRRKIEIPRRPTASGPFEPEPVLPEAQYEQALDVLRTARNALERTPSMTANLDEEKIRDLLLVILNAQFEGAPPRRRRSAHSCGKRRSRTTFNETRARFARGGPDSVRQRHGSCLTESGRCRSAGRSRTRSNETGHQAHLQFSCSRTKPMSCARAADHRAGVRPQRAPQQAPSQKALAVRSCSRL